jgi:hypothetical protein
MTRTDEYHPADDPAGPDPTDDPRLVAAVREYQAALDAGRPPDRAAFLARHPAVAAELADCLDGLSLLTGLLPRPADEVAAGVPLGDFQIVREVGRGGMGVVYEAVQLSLGRRVALKVLPFAATLDARQLQRFRTEAMAAANLHHPHIVPVYAVGCERGTHYYAMQFVEGQTLADVIRRLRDGTEPAVALNSSPLSRKAGRGEKDRPADGPRPHHPALRGGPRARPHRRPLGR